MPMRYPSTRSNFSMTVEADNLQKHLPSYLAEEDQRALLRELKATSEGGEVEYLLSSYRDDFNEIMLQGDGWSGFQFFSFRSGERLTVRGIVLSNSCDVDPENPRDAPTNVLFAPLVKLSAYEALLAKSNINAEKIRAKIAAIRAQKTTNIFYLPANGPLKDDHIVRLDETHSMPAAAHAELAQKEKLFTLSNTGFYMLVFKLSVHFCRLQEKVNRNPIDKTV